MRMFLLLLFLLAPAVKSWEIDRCTLAEELRNSGIIGYKSYTLEDYMCLAIHSSNYDTSLNASPTEYGLFQMSSYWWCNDGKTVARKVMCGILCTKLLDRDVKDDIKCLGRIVKEPAGLTAWDTYSLNCKGKDLSYLTAGC